VRLVIHDGLRSVPISGKFEPVHYGVTPSTKYCSHTQDFQGSKLLWKQAALDGRILFFSSLNYSRQILEHSFKNGACPPSATSFPNKPSLTTATAQQTGTYTKEIKVPIRNAACTYCRTVTEYIQVWTELQRTLNFCSRRNKTSHSDGFTTRAMAPRLA
jgi:hypothetical protein